jgi:hypothetical protein
VIDATLKVILIVAIKVIHYKPSNLPQKKKAESELFNLRFTLLTLRPTVEELYHIILILQWARPISRSSMTQRKSMGQKRTTLWQISRANDSAFVRSAPVHAPSIQMVVLLTKALLLQRQTLSCALQEPKSAFSRQGTAQATRTI